MIACVDESQRFDLPTLTRSNIAPSSLRKLTPTVADIANDPQMTSHVLGMNAMYAALRAIIPINRAIIRINRAIIQNQILA